MSQSATELRQVFEDLGFYAHQISFDRAIPEASLRAALTGPHRQSAVSRLLRPLPDLFVLHPDMTRGIFFVRLAPSLTSDEQQAYSEFYPADILLCSIAPQGAARRVSCTWFGRKRQISLLTALKERFQFIAPAKQVKALEKRGWIV